MLEINELPHVTASFNAISGIFLLAGFVFIKRRNIKAHKTMMASALVASTGFLAVYLYYHFNSGLARFGGAGIVRPLYFALLTAHVLAAAAIAPLVPITVFRALKGQFDRHRRIARYTWPLWFFVSVSGVVVYVMAVYLFPWTGGA